MIDKKLFQEKYDNYRWFVKQFDKGKFTSFEEGIKKIKDDGNELLHLLSDGCGNKIGRDGDCMYWSSQGNQIFCGTCKRRKAFIKDAIKRVSN